MGKIFLNYFNTFQKLSNEIRKHKFRRTINVLDGWHSKIKQSEKNHLIIFEIILRLKEDASYYDIVRAKSELNIPPQKRSKRSCETDEAIRKSVDEYICGNINIQDCLRKLGYQMKC